MSRKIAIGFSVYAGLPHVSVEELYISHAFP